MVLRYSFLFWMRLLDTQYSCIAVDRFRLLRGTGSYGTELFVIRLETHSPKHSLARAAGTGYFHHTVTSGKNTFYS